MEVANDNATDKVISYRNRALEILSDPTNLLVEDLHSDLYYILDEEGYDVHDPMTIKEMAVISEMIRAMLYRQDGRYHEFQQIFDGIGVENDPAN